MFTVSRVLKRMLVQMCAEEDIQRQAECWFSMEEEEAEELEESEEEEKEIQRRAGCLFSMEQEEEAED